MSSRLALFALLAAVMLPASPPSLRAQSRAASAMRITSTRDGPVSNPATPAGGFEIRERFKIGVGYNYNYFPDYKRTVGDQPNITSFSGDNGVFGYDAFAEYQPYDRCGLLFGAGWRYSKLSFTQKFTPIDGYPDMVDGKVDGTFLDFYTGYRVGYDRYGFKLLSGLTWSNDQGSYLSSYGGIASRQTRSLTAWKGTFNLAFDFPLGGRFGGRLIGGYTTSWKGRDADTNARFGLDLTYSPKFAF